MSAASPSTSPPSRWRQFSLRSLLLLILLCGVGLGLWSICIEPYRRQQRLVEQIAELKGVATTEAVPTSWSSIFGEGFFINIVSIRAPRTQIDDAWMAHLRDTPRLRELILNWTPIGDAGLAHIARLKDLQSLWLNGTKATDAGLIPVQGLRKLEWLSLADTKVTDQGLASLANLNRLKQLDLRGCPIGDAGMRHIQSLSNLEALDLLDTQVTDEGIARLTGLTRLGSLLLDNTDVTEACLADLKKLPALKETSTAGTHILPSALRKAFPRLVDRKLEQALAEPTLLEFIETPLSDVVSYLGDYHKVEIFLDRRSLRDAGIKHDMPITVTTPSRRVQINGIWRREGATTLEAALRKILDPRGLKCVSGYGVLLITTKESPPHSPPRLILQPGERLSRTFSQALYAQMPIEFIETPLADVLAYISDVLKTDVQLADGAFAPGFSQIGISQTTRLPAADGLELLFHELDVYGVIENKTIHVFPGPVPREEAAIAKEQP
jgi:hypothetical protein